MKRSMSAHKSDGKRMENGNGNGEMEASNPENRGPAQNEAAQE